MTADDKINFFSQLMLTTHNLYLWQYDTSYRLQRSSCPNEEQMGTLFFLETSLQEQLAAIHSENRYPVILTNSLGLIWTAAFAEEAKNADGNPAEEAAASAGGNEMRPDGIFYLGPYFIDDSSGASIERSLHAMNLSSRLLHNAVSFLRSLPVISVSKAIEYSIMLHYTLTGEKISVSDIRYIGTEDRNENAYRTAEDPTMIHGTYAREQEMLRMVREGDLDAVTRTAQMLGTGTVGKIANNPDRQLKNMVIAAIVLFSRAAIEGGLSPELSLSISDRYFRGVEAAKSISDLADVNRTMQEDYVRRVHEIRSHSNYSAQVRAVNDYIDLHLEEPIRLAEMAKALGYSSYYLSRKYQKETGMTVTDRVKTRRIGRAKELLLDTSLPIYEISERLCFSSPSYFTENFRRLTGMTPAEFRDRKGSLL